MSATVSELALRVPLDRGDLPPHCSLGKEPGSQLQGHRRGQASVPDAADREGQRWLRNRGKFPSTAPGGAQNASEGRGVTCRHSSRVRGRALPLPGVRPSHWASCPGGCMQAPGRGPAQSQVPAGTTVAPGPRRRTEHRDAPNHAPGVAASTSPLRAGVGRTPLPWALPSYSQPYGVRTRRLGGHAGLRGRPRPFSPSTFLFSGLPPPIQNSYRCQLMYKLLIVASSADGSNF